MANNLPTANAAPRSWRPNLSPSQRRHGVDFAPRPLFSARRRVTRGVKELGPGSFEDILGEQLAEPGQAVGVQTRDDADGTLQVLRDPGDLPAVPLLQD